MVRGPRVRATGHEYLTARVPVPPLLGEMVAARSAGVRAESSGLEGAKPQEELKQPLEQNPQSITSNLSRAAFIALVERAQRYIRACDIYQVNLAQRLAAPCDLDGWELFQRLAAVSPGPSPAPPRWRLR